ncbi:MAG: hypothetical protein Q8R66_11260 [Methanobacteriaceae archaeon]|nr:hypothetical protein [Methanobacteriaceae archaeon]
MKNKNSNPLVPQDRTISWRRSKKGWSMIIMPDSIRIDNNHGYCHIHLEYKKNYQNIKENSLEAIYSMITDHIEINNGINLDELKKELIN